jgi:hypothetical protein
VEAKRPGQPKPSQGPAAGFAGRAEDASLDGLPAVRQRSSRRSWQGLSQFCEPVCQAANGANWDVDPLSSLLGNTAGLGAVPGCNEGALRLKTADSTPCGGRLILLMVHGGVIFATEPLSFICFGAKPTRRSAARKRCCTMAGLGVSCGSGRCALSVSCNALGRVIALPLLLLAVIKPINDTVKAAKDRAAAYSGVQSGRSAVAEYMPALPDCVRGQDARRPDSGFAKRRPSGTAFWQRRARLLCSATGAVPKRD